VILNPLMLEVDALIRRHTESSDVALQALLNVMLSYAVAGKEEGATWAQLRTFLLTSVARDFDRMVTFVEAGRAAA
jgi:hypothetical protein